MTSIPGYESENETEETGEDEGLIVGDHAEPRVTLLGHPENAGRERPRD